VPAELLMWQWDSEPARRFQDLSSTRNDDLCHLSSALGSCRPVVFVSQKPSVIEVDC